MVLGPAARPLSNRVVRSCLCFVTTSLSARESVHVGAWVQVDMLA